MDDVSTLRSKYKEFTKEKNKSIKELKTKSKSKMTELEAVEGLKKVINKMENKIKLYKDAINKYNKLKRSETITKMNQKKKLLKTINDINIVGETKTRDDRINKFTENNNLINNNNETFNERVERGYYDRRALGDVFSNIVIDGEDIKIYKRNSKNGDVETYGDDFINIVSKSLIRKLIQNNNKFYLNCNMLINYVCSRKVKGEVQYKDFWFNSPYAERILSPNQCEDLIIKWFGLFVEGIKAVLKSEFKFEYINNITLQFSLRRKTKAGSYIETPKILNSKKAIVNVKNEDDFCLIWSLCAFLYYDIVKVLKSNKSKYYKKYFDEIKIPENQTFPIDVLNDIPKFEKLNNITINVFGYKNNIYNNDNRYIVYKSNFKCENICNLLLLNEGDKNHFCLIKNIDRLYRMDDKNKRYVCQNCLSNNFISKEKLDKHLLICEKNEAVAIKLPDEKYNKIRFVNHQNEFKHPFFVSMDFESTLEDCNIISESEETIKYQKHKANSCGLKFCCDFDNYDEGIKIFNNSDEDKLMEDVILECERMAKKSWALMMKNKTNIIMNKKDWDIYNNSKCCFECEKEFSDKVKKVRHHHHITGEFISVLCSKCNLKFKSKLFLPIYIHNLKGYDSHFIVPNLLKYGYKDDDKTDVISCIPNNEERYISFSKKILVYEEDNFKQYFEIRFLDSIGFMNSSLCSLVDNLKSGCDDIKELRKRFKYTSQELKNDNEFKLMISKGIYPYDYVNDYSKLNVEYLPSIENFYSKLNDEHCSNEDYERAINVWNTFKCKTFLDYHNLYLKSDVLLLADVWANFREVCYENYKLDCNYYYTAPSLSWDAFLKCSSEWYEKKYNEDFYLELITDEDIYLFVEDNIRGGLSQISKRYAKANNKYMENYNKNIEDSYILYLDANNLYGSSMCQYLPMKDFKWNDNIWTNEDILNLDDEGDKGYLFDVDIHYPKKLHDKHNGYALFPENKIIKNEELNEWQNNGRIETDIKKLITSFYDKKNYGINYRLLKLCIKLGLEIKINRCLEYYQCNYMKCYIEKNTELRKKAKNDFEKDFYKLMNNSVYGKTMENVRNRINFKLIDNPEKALNLKCIQKKHTIFNENLVGVHLLKQEVYLNKPIYIGQNVLDESKLIMYNFHYNFMLEKIEKKNIDLLFTDTDSLCYHIKNIDPYEIIKNNKSYFDLSDYDKNHPLYDITNKKVPAKFKDESNGHIISEFIGLRSKCYSYILDGEEHKKGKGVKRCVLKNSISHDDYKNTLFNLEDKIITQNGIRSYKHQLFTVSNNKIGLSRFDDKCYILDDKINTLTLGHYKISEV